MLLNSYITFFICYSYVIHYKITILCNFLRSVNHLNLLVEETIYKPKLKIAFFKLYRTM